MTTVVTGDYGNSMANVEMMLVDQGIQRREIQIGLDSGPRTIGRKERRRAAGTAVFTLSPLPSFLPFPPARIAVSNADSAENDATTNCL